jgi:uncharacterized protein DUF402
VRYRALGHDRLLGARPLRFLGVRNGYVAGWLPGGTDVADPVLADGRPLRAVEAADWFTADLASVQRPWSGVALVLVPLVGAHSVWLFWDDDGTFGNWYVNLERRHVWHSGGCDTRDTLLDVVCDAPRLWRWKDEDELEVAVAVGAMTRDDATGVRAEGERIAAAIERWESPFADGWERWRADPTWQAPELPPDWDA